MTKQSMTPLEQHLLDVIQDAFPLEERPYQVLADMLNGQGSAGEPSRESLTEQQVFDAVEGLRQSGIIRRIGGIYDSHKLGFISRLCAGKVADLEKFADAASEIPAITHNYVRTHEYNVWFTVIAENEADVQKVVDALCSKTDLHDVHILTVTKKFKINTVMRKGVVEKDEARNPLPSVILSGRQVAKDPDPKALSDSDRVRIRIACTDIPHTLTPFKDWGVSIEELRNDIAGGFMRRFGAILRHQQAGFAYNAMVCFVSHVIASEAKQSNLTDNDAGAILAQNPHISHCYERPAFEGFPYTLYAMMHAQSAGELEQYVKDAVESIGNPDYAILHSVRELKKTSFRFF